MIDLSGVEVVLPYEFVKRAVEHYLNHSLRDPIEVEGIAFEHRIHNGVAQGVAIVRVGQHAGTDDGSPHAEIVESAVFGARKVTVAS